MKLFLHQKLTVILLIILLFQLLPITANSQTPLKFRPSEKAFKQADKQLKKMSLDEKIGQLIHVGINAQFLNQESAEYKELKRQIVENHVGGIVVFVGDVYETVHLVNRMQESAKIPLLISADFETGVGMRFPDAVNFPWNMAVAATGNPEYARREGVIAGREAKALGVRWDFAPDADVNNNPNNPVINVRSYGENADEVARFTTAFMQGIQSENVLATAKHFPGHGDTAVDSHRGLPIIDFSRERLEKTEFVPFRALIDNGIGSIMISHISMPQLDAEKVQPLKIAEKAAYTDSQIVTEAATIPATLSPNIVGGILRKEMNFDGLIVTDAMDMSGLTLYFNPEEAAVRAVLAGNDVLLKPSSADAPIRGIREAVKSGRITEARIDESVRKILAWKFQFGLDKQKITALDAIDTIVSGVETRKLADEIAQDAITLVKNDEKLLPLKADSKVAVLCITNGEDRNFVGNTLTATLRQNNLKVERIVIDERASPKEIEDAIAKSKAADYVVAGLFGRVRSGAKNSIGLPESGEKVLREVLKSDAKVISASFGNPYLLLGFPEIKNYIVAYGDMSSLQRAAADKITGKSEFKGRLPISIGEFTRGK